MNRHNYSFGITTLVVLLCGVATLGAQQDAARTQFLPGRTWPDDKGVHINAHGGRVMAHGGAYYWFGEHKVAGEAGEQGRSGCPLLLIDRSL